MFQISNKNMDGHLAKRLCLKFGLCKHKSAPHIKNMVSKLNKNLATIQYNYKYNLENEIDTIHSTKHVFSQSKIPIDIIENIYSYLDMTPNQKQILINRFNLHCEINHIDHHSMGICSFIRTEKKTFFVRSCNTCGYYYPFPSMENNFYHCNCH